MGKICIFVACCAAGRTTKTRPGTKKEGELAKNQRKHFMKKYLEQKKILRFVFVKKKKNKMQKLADSIKDLRPLGKVGQIIGN